MACSDCRHDADTLPWLRLSCLPGGGVRWDPLCDECGKRWQKPTGFPVTVIPNLFPRDHTMSVRHRITTIDRQGVPSTALVGTDDATRHWDAITGDAVARRGYLYAVWAMQRVTGEWRVVDQFGAPPPC